MKNHLRGLIVAAVVLLCAFLGWWMVRDLRDAFQSPPRHAGKSGRASFSPSAAPSPAAPAPRAFKSAVRPSFEDGATVEMLASCNPDEAILRFPTSGTYGAFLEALARSKVRLVDRLDRLRAMRLSYDDPLDLDLLLADENITAYTALPRMPDRSFPGANLQPDALGFGGRLMDWLGMAGVDRSKWGAGVKIAVLDTGIVPHPALPTLSQSIAIVPFPDDPGETHGHGTAVASLIAASHPSAHGIAPAAELISIRVTGESGVTDSFALAAGILAAVDAGAHLINLSMGSYDNSPLTEEACLLAQNEGIVIVAAAGNDGLADAAYPAAYPGIISVGAVDARGRHLEFSNYGEYLYITAPGYFINAAWPGDKFVRFSGTSASAPVVTGILAATMSDGSSPATSAAEAVEIMTRQADDAGIPGPDSEYGFGIVNLRRMLNRKIPGVVDAAISDQRISPSPSGGHEIQVTVQNRGTETLLNTLVEVSSPAGPRQFNVTTIAPGAIQTFSIPIHLNALPPGRDIEVTSRAVVGSGLDVTPENNRRTDAFSPR